MSRPNKARRVCREPLFCSFKADTDQRKSENALLMSVEEYETIRLMDYMGCDQKTCASQMQVSRATVQVLYTEARKKMARFLVEGIPLKIAGGDYELCRAGFCPREQSEETCFASKMYYEKKIGNCETSSQS